MKAMRNIFAILAFLFGAFPLFAQIAFVQSTSRDCGTGTSCNLAFASNNILGNLVVVAVRSGSTSATVTISDSQANTYVNQISQNQTTNGHKLTVAYAANVKPGANTVTVTVSASTTIRVAIHEYGGVFQTNPVDVSASTQGSGTAPSSGNVTTTQSPELLFAAGAVGAAPTWTSGAGYTLRQTPANALATEDQIVASSGTFAGTFSLSATDNWSAGVIAFKGLVPAYTNVTNSFTSMQNFDSDVHLKGPNPYFDIMRYGGYQWNILSPPTMTCSISSGTTTLNCTSNPDFQNGQGIMVPLAGAATTLPSAPTPSVTPFWVTNGSTTRAYKYAFEGYSGDITAAGSAGATTTSVAALGNNTVSLTGVVRASGLDTYTCSGNCNVAPGAQVQVAGYSLSFNGTMVVNTAPTSSTFTVFANGLPDASVSGAATLTTNACNLVLATGSYGGAESVIKRTLVYRQDGGVGNFNLVGIAMGQDPSYMDCGLGVSNVPAYIPLTAPASPQPGYLSTAIVSGGGTNTLTLANAAGSTATSQTVQHNNTPNLLSAWTACLAAGGGDVLLPVTGSPSLFYIFTSTLDLTSISNPNNRFCNLRISQVDLFEPWIPQGNMKMEGIAQVSNSFQYVPIGSIGGTAFPLMLANQHTHGAFEIDNLKIYASATGSSAVVLDETLGPGGITGAVFKNDSFIGTDAPCMVIKGGFHFWFDRPTCGVLGASSGTFRQPPGILLTTGSAYLTTSSQAPGDIIIEKGNFSGGVAVQLDNLPMIGQPNFNTTGPPGNCTFKNILHEDNAGAFFRVYMPNGAFGSACLLDEIQFADAPVGTHQPVAEMTGTTNWNVMNIMRSYTQGNPTLLGTLAGLMCYSNASAGCGGTPNRNMASAQDIVDGAIIGVINNGSIGYLMGTPAAPASCVVSAGGSVPVGSVQYLIAAVDRSNFTYNPYAGVTLVGPSCSVTTSSGNQTVTITRPTLPAGAVGWLVYRTIGGGTANILFDGCSPGVSIAAGTASVADAAAGTCGASAPSLDTALTASVNSAGLSTGKINLSTEAFTASPRAVQNIFLPGALTATWTGSAWILDKGITVTRVQVQAKTAPSGCSTNAIIRLSDGSNNVNVTVAAAANDSGSISQAYAAAAALTISVQTAASGCGTSPADANVVVQYRMQ